MPTLMTGRYVYYVIRFTIAACQFYIFKKNPDVTGFVKIKSRHPDGLNKKQIWMKKTEMGALIYSSILHAL